jgi:FMN phosphatase YigB (HAD superfamily)
MATSLPMPQPTNPPRPLSSYKVISFDVYGTLIDFKPAIYTALQPLLKRLAADSPWRQPNSSDMHSDVGSKLLNMFKQQEDDLMVNKPIRPFNEVLEEIYLRIAANVEVNLFEAGLREEAKAFGGSVGELPPYEDTVESCQRLERLGFKLVFLSNIEKVASGKTSGGVLKDVRFWKYYSANDFEQDDPDRRKLEFLVKQVKQDVESEGGELSDDEILHVANSLGHDHVPAKKLGLSTVWIVRDSIRWGKAQEMKDSLSKVGYGWRFTTLKEFVDAVENDVKSAGGR